MQSSIGGVQTIGSLPEECDERCVTSGRQRVLTDVQTVIDTVPRWPENGGFFGHQRRASPRVMRIRRTRRQIHRLLRKKTSRPTATSAMTPKAAG